jgi:2-methylcitrate dehydratase
MEYPVGHKRRREEGLPLLRQKDQTNLARVFDADQCARIEEATLDYDQLVDMPVDDFVSLFVKQE